MPEQSSPRVKSKSWLIGLIVIVGGAALLASVQEWLHVAFAPGVSVVQEITVSGQKISPALTLIALAALASALVLTIAGIAFRKVLGVLVALLGAGLATIGTTFALDPLGGARSQIEEATGIAGATHSGLVASFEASIWPIATAAVGVLLIVQGVAVVLVSGRWKSAGRKYDAVEGSQRKAARVVAEGDRISEWDALSDGEDPTEFEPPVTR
ncbi:MAG: Trp biosynthesis-associated membrane protein [Leucobacter sp.]